MESLRRRDFIRGLSLLSVAAGVKPAVASYNPAAKFDVKVSEVEYRRTKAGRQLMARIYEPAGTGPFPTVLDLHGGAWNAKDRKAEEPMDRAIAESGVLVVAVDLTLAPESPYPACVQDANYRAGISEARLKGKHLGRPWEAIVAILSWRRVHPTDKCYFTNPFVPIAHRHPPRDNRVYGVAVRPE